VEPAPVADVPVRVTDPRHPLFGKELPLVSMTGSRLARGHVYVRHGGTALLMIPISSTSLRAAPQAPRSKLTADAAAALLARVREIREALACASAPERSGGVCRTPDERTPSPRSPRRCGR
jgi:hypothetical protein